MKTYTSSKIFPGLHRPISRYYFLLGILTLICSASVFSQSKKADAKIKRQPEMQFSITRNGVPMMVLPGTKTAEEKNQNEALSLRKETSASVTFQPVSGPRGGTVRSFAQDSDGWLYAATDGEVYRSSDNGEHWSMNLFPSQLHNSVEPVTVLGKEVLIAETDFSNFISTDKGGSWKYISTALHGFVMDTTGIVYAGSDGNGVLRSVDTAKSWQPFALDGKKIWKIVFCGDSKIACSSDSGLYLSSDTGKTWTYKPYETPYTWNLVSDKRGHLFSLHYYGGYFELFRSSDFGETWQHINLPVGGDAYRIYIENDGKIIVPVGSSILTSTDAGESWSELVCPIGGVLSVGRDNAGNLLAGTFYGIHKYDSGSGQWEDLNNGIHARRIEKIEFPSSGTILALSLGTIFRSDDGGSSWSSAAVDSGTYVYSYSPFLTASSGTVFTCASINNGSECGLLRSTDDGLTWKKISVLANYYALYALAEGSSGDIVTASSAGDIYRSTDQGDSWSKVFSSTDQSEIYCMAADKNGRYYAAKDSSVLVSNDGSLWTPVSLNRGYSSWQSMSVDSRGEIFLGTSNRGIFHSSDKGASWHETNTNLFDTYIMSTAADDSGNVVAGSSSGVFRLADSSNSWMWYSSGFPQTFTTSIAISQDGYVFAGTQDFGMYKSDVPLGSRAPAVVPPPVIFIRDFSLDQNYPNPFNAGTVIQYELPYDAAVTIKIYNTLGQVVETLASGWTAKGEYHLRWNPLRISSGLYFCEMRGVNGPMVFHKTIKLLYLR